MGSGSSVDDKEIKVIARDAEAAPFARLAGGFFWLHDIDFILQRTMQVNLFLV